MIPLYILGLNLVRKQVVCKARVEEIKGCSTNSMHSMLHTEMHKGITKLYRVVILKIPNSKENFTTPRACIHKALSLTDLYTSLSEAHHPKSLSSSLTWII